MKDNKRLMMRGRSAHLCRIWDLASESLHLKGLRAMRKIVQRYRRSQAAFGCIRLKEERKQFNEKES